MNTPESWNCREKPYTAIKRAVVHAVTGRFIHDEVEIDSAMADYRPKGTIPAQCAKGFGGRCYGSTPCPGKGDQIHGNRLLSQD